MALLFCLCGGLSAQETTLTFQQGVDGYEGLTDMVIGRNNVLDDVDLQFGESNLLGADVENYFLDGKYGDFYESADEKQALLRFDGIFAEVPAGATIVSATLEITTSSPEFSSNSQSGGPYGVSQLLVPFDNSTTYNNTIDGLRFSDGETANPLANGFESLEPSTPGVADITEIVAAWYGGDVNHGVTVTAGTTDGWGIVTSGNLDPTLSPKLTLTYTTESQPECETGTLEQVTGDASTQMFFASPEPALPEDQLVDGDTILDGFIFLDGNGNLGEALIRFNEIFESDGGNGFVPDGAEIKKATLIVTTANFVFSSNVGTRGEYSVRQVLADWDDASAYADLSFGAFVDGEGKLISDAEAKYDVTSIVEAWQGGEGNFGFNIASSGTNDGWAPRFQTTPTGGAPRLIIEYVVPTFVLGDANGDGALNNLDIAAFVLAIQNRTLYEMMYPDIDPDVVLDMNGDGVLNNLDIADFVAAILAS